MAGLVCLALALSTLLDNRVLAIECSISQVETRVGSTSATVSWSIGDCISSVDRYVVVVEHLNWLACLLPTNDSEESGKRNLEIFQTRLELTRLYPYSTYSVEIRALDPYKTVLDTYKFDLTTKSDVPDTKPTVKLQGGSLVYSQSVRFNWNAPGQDQCRHQNGRQDGYWVELRGLDPWVLEPFVLTNQSVSGLFYHAGDLLPYTSYMLRVFSQNVGGLVNKNLYLELQERTGAQVPAPPVNVSASPVSDASVYLSWKPAYPRTGLIEKYVVREGVVEEDGKHVWSKQISVNTVHHEACSDKLHRSEGFVCYVISQLLPATNYIFQIQTINKGIETGSGWSESVFATTHHEQRSRPSPPFNGSQGSAVTQQPATTASPNQDNSSWTLVVVFLVVGGVVVLGTVSAVLIYKLKLDKLKARLELEHSISLGRLDSTYGPYSPPSTSTQATSYAVSPNSFIQDRRLPEPPPVKPGDHVYAQPYTQQGYLDMSLGRFSGIFRTGDPEYTVGEGAGGGGEVGGGEGDSGLNDMDGYLRPTFKQKTCDVEEKDPSVACVPAASYGEAGQLSSRPDLLPPPGSFDRSSPSSLTSSSSNHPLVISKSVDI